MPLQTHVFNLFDLLKFRIDVDLSVFIVKFFTNDFLEVYFGYFIFEFDRNYFILGVGRA